MAKPIKDKVKDKAKALKEKLKGAAKASKPVKAAVAVCALALAGCQTPDQTSRGTSNRNGDFEPSVKVEIGANASSNTVVVTVPITLGDGAIASADSSGSTETQTQTPTFDVSPKTDLRYNDALSAATATSKGIIATLTDEGANKVLAMMQSGGNGTVEVERKDGTMATIACSGGQCAECRK